MLVIKILNGLHNCNKINGIKFLSLESLAVKNQAKEFNKELKQQDQDVISLRFFSNFCAKIGVINRSNLRQSNLLLDVLRNLRFLRTKNILNVILMVCNCVVQSKKKNLKSFSNKTLRNSIAKRTKIIYCSGGKKNVSRNDPISQFKVHDQKD
ncbi:hypothetical protein BpHYR1_004601 [Brachionus plicatilis]|uniref:Uncharacterized protein n=1 Tax=Brachionus plicatilis TaxID=10195 RepID=A0A3M7PB00_BRAPC|nr:hypothetical protein BpHYR1_004601 [Brachionus plicatilis]